MLIFMRKLTICAGCLMTIGLLASVVGIAKDPPAAQPKRPVPLKDIRERGVEGTLGPRLGTIVDVSGEVVANDSRAKADASEPFFLRIEEVDGVRLEAPRSFSSTAMPLIRNVPDLKVGDAFRCFGYETGEFRGLADGEERLFGAPRAGQAFHFAVQFEVLKLASTKE